MSRRLQAEEVAFPIRGSFTISRGSVGCFLYGPCGSGMRMLRMRPSPSTSSTVSPSTGSSSQG